MKALMKEVEAAAQNELNRANEKFPLFNSAYEGWAVIQKEAKESEANLKAMAIALNDFTEDVFGNKDTRNILAIIKGAAAHAAAELIQVTAMCKKFEASRPEMINSKREDVKRNMHE